MQRESKLSDETLRQYLSHGFSQHKIAELCGLSQPAIAKRVKNLEKKALAQAPEQAVRAVSSMWDTRTAAEENYRRCIELLDDCENASEKRGALAEIRQHLQFGMQVMETLYTVQEVQMFQEEVLTILDECEPGTRQRILSRLQERRTLRAAFLPH